MNTKIRTLSLALLISLSSNAYAHDIVSLTDVYADVLIYRPIGLAMTVAGAALFAAMSPMLAIANLSSSNDAFTDAKDSLIMTPYNFTFNRPLGAIRPDALGVYQKP